MRGRRILMSLLSWSDTTAAGESRGSGQRASKYKLCRSDIPHRREMRRDRNAID